MVDSFPVPLSGVTPPPGPPLSSAPNETFAVDAVASLPLDGAVAGRTFLCKLTRTLSQVIDLHIQIP